VSQHVRESLELELLEEGWSLTDGEARLVIAGDDPTGLISGAMRVLAPGRLLFTPGALTRDVAPNPDGEDAQEVIDRRGRNLAQDAGQRREAYRVDMMLDVVVLFDGRELPAQTLNVSPTGCLLRGTARPFIDSMVVVRIPVEEGRQLQLRAQVIRVDEERYALHFREMDAAQDRHLSQLLAKRQREILRRR
jgi:hypothetical protein